MKMCVCVSVLGVCAAQTGRFQGDPGGAEGPVGLHGAGELPPSLSDSVQSHALSLT